MTTEAEMRVPMAATSETSYPTSVYHRLHMIDVSHLTKLYGDVKAVSDFSFRVEPGEIVGLIGPNGAGKTSTLRCIVGIQKPSSGTISIGGHDIVGDPVEAKRRLAFMADEPHLFEYLTVAEHLRLTARIYRVRDFEPRAQALLEELELTGKANMLPGELSRGMKQKVAIACGLLHDPAALLFDEPLTGLDPLGIRRMRETIVARGRNGGAVIVSSHMLHMVEEICTRVVIIDRGVKMADGTLAELSAQAMVAGAGSNLEQIFLKVTSREEAAPAAAGDR
jgi:ABC-2 type transport system ATP-binding protein